MRKIIVTSIVCALVCSTFVGCVKTTEQGGVYEIKEDLLHGETVVGGLESAQTPIEVVETDLVATGATISTETLSFTDANSAEIVEEDFIKIAYSDVMAQFKIRGLLDEYEYGQKMEISFSLYYTAEDYNEVSVLDESGAVVKETMRSGALTPVYCTAHVFVDDDGNFVTFSIENIGSSFVYLKDITIVEYAERTEELFGGATLYQIHSSLGLGQMGYLITTKNGKNIMIDGGNPKDTSDVLNVLRKNGCVVDAWFLTHPHDDHICVATEILNNYPEIKVKAFYYNFPTVEEAKAVEPESASYISAFLDAVAQSGVEVKTIARGDEFTFDGVTFKVLNDLLVDGMRMINEMNMVIKMFTEGKDVLFLGDAGPQLSEYLLANCREDLPTDIVQMAHHGQNGVTYEVYEAIAPTICLWPAPKWVWINALGTGDLPNSAHLLTYEVRYWMDKLGVKEHYIAKDGLIVLK